jgi:hypothetical protein
MSNYPSHLSRFRFALATLLSRLSFRACSEDFIVRFCEETDERIEWEEPHNRGPVEVWERWTPDGTQRIG